MTIGSIQYNPTLTGSAPAPTAPAPAPQAPAAPAAPADGVSLGHRIAQLPRQIVEGTAGLVGGAIGSVYHAAPGAVEGIAEGLTTERGTGGTGWYTTVLLTESVATGFAVGAAVAGPAGMLIGAGAGLVGGILFRVLEGHADVPQRFVQKVETTVDQAIAQNTDGSKVKIAVQNATQGMILGTGVGVREGWNIGREAGKGLVSGVMDVAYGVAEGVYEAIRGPKKG